MTARRPSDELVNRVHADPGRIRRQGNRSASVGIVGLGGIFSAAANVHSLHSASRGHLAPSGAEIVQVRPDENQRLEILKLKMSLI